jgi:hypothetical protein
MLQKSEGCQIQMSPSCQDNNHACEDFTVKTAEGEMVCIKCGRVDEHATSIEALYTKSESEDKATSLDHNAGNGLLDSETLQSKYVSMRNKGLAFLLNDTRQKDAQGHKVKPQLRDPYKAGLLADPTVGYHVEEDILTGESRLKFSKYDAPLIPSIKMRALQRCISYELDTVEQTLISQEIKRLYSQLVMSSVVDYIVVASLLRYQYLLPASAKLSLEKEMADIIEKIRIKLVSGCQKSKDL